MERIDNNMPRRPKGSVEGNIDYAKRGTSQEKTVLMTLKDMIKTDSKVYYVLWKYAPDLLPKNTLDNPIKTFEDLVKAYECIKADQRMCENYLMEENVQNSIAWLRGRQHKHKMYALYDKFCEKALSGDVQAFKAVLEFGDKYFKGSEEAELLKVIHGVDLNGSSDDDDFDFKE